MSFCTGPTDAPTNIQHTTTKNYNSATEAQSLIGIMAMIVMGTLAVAMLAGLLAWVTWNHCKATGIETYLQVHYSNEVFRNLKLMCI